MNKPRSFSHITATYRIVTPMFCAGADQQSAELRLSSFKGALRFWWRTLMWGKLNGDVKKLHEQEAELFGSSDSRVGQSKVRMRLRKGSGTERDVDATILQNRSGAAYLAYGMTKLDRGKPILVRRAMRGTTFSVDIQLLPRLSQDTERIEQLIHTLTLLGTFGGMGSRSRRGYGSMCLVELLRDNEPIQLPPVEQILREIVSRTRDHYPLWTAWSPHSRAVRVATKHHDGIDALNEAGLLLGGYRSWQGQEEISNFPEDHHIIYDYLHSGQRRGELPERIAFGLPHNYFYRSLSDTNPNVQRFVKAEITPEKRNDGQGLTRRGSPLLIHINDNSSVVFAFLPALFLPKNNEGVTVADTTRDKSRQRQPHRAFVAKPVTDQTQFFKPINDFLDHVLATSSIASEVKLV